jgi:hypothetical protein
VSNCPFCRCDPCHYEDVGIGYVPVAITCCDMGISLFAGNKTERAAARRILRLRSSHSPRRKARAQRLLALIEAGEYP